MVVIPYEIWLHIASFLSKDEIWNLRYLSHVFLDIALDSRYRTLHFSVRFRTTSEYMSKFERFRNPDIAKRVQHISYLDHASTMFPGKPRMKTSIKNRFQSLFDKKGPPTHADTVETMTSFTNVVSLNLRLILFRDGDTYIEDCVPLIHANFRTCFAQLQSLVLHIPLSYFPIIILPDLSFPCLTSLAMTLFSPTKEESLADMAKTTILPFMNQHRQTLTSVNFLSTGVQHLAMDLSPLYQGLGHFPSLRRVTVSVTPLTQLAIIGQFLETHCETLRDMEIGLTETPYKRVDDLFRIVTQKFPNIEKFSVTFPGLRQSPLVEQSLDITAAFVQRCSTSLVSLDMMAGAHSTQKLRELLDPRRTSEPFFVRLRHLHISVHTITPDVLDMFASQLPNLNSLEVFASCLKCRENLPDTLIDYYEFTLQMIRRDYSAWKLEHITLFCEKSGRATNSSGPMAIARAIPSLKTLNGININMLK